MSYSSLMELCFPSFPILFTFIVFLFMIMKIGKNLKAQNSKGKLPPGPWKLPLIGNLHHLFGPLPHHTLRDLAKKYGALMHLQLGEISTVVVSSPEVAKEVMKTHDLIFAQRPELLSVKILSYDSTDIAFAPYGDYWRQLRKICKMELLCSKRVQSFQLLREEEVSNFIQYIFSMKGLPINISEKILSLIYGITSRAAFGKKCKYQEEFISLVDEGIKLSSGSSVADTFPSQKLLHVISGVKAKLERAHIKVDRILESIIDEHREKKKSMTTSQDEAEEDLVDVLLRLQGSGDLEFPITTDNIKAVILEIFGAGSESSSTVVEWAMSEMLRDQEAMEKAQAEVRDVFSRKRNVDEMGIHDLNYLKLVIKETLRLHPPAPLLLPRESRERCEINGYEIPTKTQVIINAWALGRNPEHWINAESFQPERFLNSSIDYKGNNFEYIPFGAGRRICPGILFGVANVELLLAQLLYHFDWKLPSGSKPEDLDMTEAFGSTVRRRSDLYLIPTPYSPSPVE